MKKWNYTLKNGLALREAIYEENHIRVLLILKKCYSEIVDYFVSVGLTEEEDKEAEYQDYIENINLLLEINNDEEETVEENINLDEDDVNYELSNFYDLCDNCSIWVQI